MAGLRSDGRRTSAVMAAARLALPQHPLVAVRQQPLVRKFLSALDELQGTTQPLINHRNQGIKSGLRAAPTSASLRAAAPDPSAPDGGLTFMALEALEESPLNGPWAAALTELGAAAEPWLAGDDLSRADKNASAKARISFWLLRHQFP